VVKLDRIYTRGGDDGTSGLVDGSRLAKHHPLFGAMGDVDELNSAIGVALAHLPAGHPARPALLTVQNDLFDLGADLATPAAPGADFAPSDAALRITPARVAWLEARIDALTAELAPLTSFILPGGTVDAAHLHLARGVARRAERSWVAAAADTALNPVAGHYLNRLSDYLFVLARTANDGGAGDVLWVPGGARN
jgi:cob(I)alamin adenosyltransferase